MAESERTLLPFDSVSQVAETAARLPGERIQKVLAHAGVASRRAAEEMVLAGRVQVNGEVVTTLGLRVDPAEDELLVDGVAVQVGAAATTHTYLVLHKPQGVVTTTHDPEGRPTVLDLVPLRHRVYPVGRLDWDSEGLLLLTDDGDLTYRLTHPRYGVEKEYAAQLTSRPDWRTFRALVEGVELEDGVARAVLAEPLHDDGEEVWIRVVMQEGRNREVRRLLAAVECPVRRLVRTRLGPLKLGTLPSGAHRFLDKREVAGLRRTVGLKP